MRSFLASRPTLLVVALVLGFGLRLVYTFGYAGFDAVTGNIGGDALSYLRHGYLLAKTGTYGSPAGVDVKAELIAGEQPAVAAPSDRGTNRPPLWPGVLAILLLLTRFDLLGLYLLRFLLDAVTLVLFARLLASAGLRLRWYAFALFGLALHPTWLIYSVTFLSEPFSMLVQVAFALAALAWVQHPASLRRAGVAGALAAAVLLTHPFYFFYPVFAIAVLVALRAVPMRTAAAACAGLVLALAPWLVRNMLFYDTWKPILTTHSGQVLAAGWSDTFLARYRNTTVEIDVNPDPVAGVDLASLDWAQRSSVYAADAMRRIPAQWRMVPAITTRKLVGALTPIPETARAGLLESGRFATQLLTLVPLGLFLLCGHRWRHPLWPPVLALIAGYAAMSVLTYASIRFRAPLIWAEWLALAIVCDRMAAFRLPWLTTARAAGRSSPDA